MMMNDVLLHRLGVALCVLFWLLAVTILVSAAQGATCRPDPRQQGEALAAPTERDG
jgi:hypothetical protein